MNLHFVHPTFGKNIQILINVAQQKEHYWRECVIAD